MSGEEVLTGSGSALRRSLARHKTASGITLA